MTHGAKTVAIPWAGKNSRFTLLLEAFAIRVLTAARSVEEARKLLGLSWHQAEAVKARAVQRSLAKRYKRSSRMLAVIAHSTVSETACFSTAGTWIWLHSIHTLLRRTPTKP
ncbi:MAG: transposase family protein [Thiotrichaceae bacterium]|nr:transposase family protein [Thiotrichaceae bacterium]